ncbi:MAG: LysR substrate-binding domain-containing protein [Bacillota bacterium]
MNIQQLEVFILIVEKQSFSEVGRLLRMTQPAISFQMQSLEKQLGVTLFTRSRRGINLTAQGKTYYRFAKEIVSLHKQAMDILNQSHGRVLEKILVGIETDTCNYILPRLLGCFKQRYPYLGVICQAGNTKEVNTWLRKDLVDICVVGNPNFAEEGFSIYPFLEDELLLVVSPSHPVAGKPYIQPQELESLQLVVREKGSASREMLEEACLNQGIRMEKLNLSMVVPDNEAIKAILQSGFGAAIMSRWTVIKELNLGLLKEVPFAEPILQYQISIVLRKEKEEEPEIERLVRFLLASRVGDNNILCFEGKL